MRRQEEFYKTVFRIALPITLQALLQSSFSVVDQLMIGSLGSGSIAGIGLGGKFASLYSVLLSAVAAAAGILISQYMGKEDEEEVSRSFFLNLLLVLGLAVLFTVLCAGFSESIMGFYTKDEQTRRIAAEYLRILAFSFLPMAVGILLTTWLRCMEAAALPLYCSIFAVLLNTIMNYLLIFGKAGFPELGVRGAAAATVFSQWVSCVLIFGFFWRYYRRQDRKLRFLWRLDGRRRKQYASILCPILICEFLWSLGENVYGAIYGNMGTAACAAMTLTMPVLSILISAMSGLGQAAGILIGKRLGSQAYETAYEESKKLMQYGFYGSCILSLLLLLSGRYYVRIYQVEPEVRRMAEGILLVVAAIAPVKVQNMILGGGIIRSGGKTKYVMWIDLIGTWLFGVPLGLLSAFAWKMTIPYVYFILSLEECVRYGISWLVFQRKGWMRNLSAIE